MNQKKLSVNFKMILKDCMAGGTQAFPGHLT